MTLKTKAAKAAFAVFSAAAILATWQLVPDAVSQFIKEHHLYENEK